MALLIHYNVFIMPYKTLYNQRFALINHFKHYYSKLIPVNIYDERQTANKVSRWLKKYIAIY